MAYRRTEAVVRRLAARHEAIVDAAAKAAGEGGMAAVQMATVAERAGIAAGTIYRYFPAKPDLVGALIARVCERELDAMRRATAAAPGPLSALAAALATFGARALFEPRLFWAVMSEPVDAEIEALRLEYRRALALHFQERIEAAVEQRLLPEQDAAVAAPALVGALLEGLAGPMSAARGEGAAGRRAAVQTLTLFALRGLGVADARARGIVVQIVLPDETDAVEP